MSFLINQFDVQCDLIIVIRPSFIALNKHDRPMCNFQNFQLQKAKLKIIFENNDQDVVAMAERLNTYY
jgi:hypothetical protein